MSHGKNLSLGVQKVAQLALPLDDSVIVRYNTSDVFAMTVSPHAASRERSCPVESCIPVVISDPVCQLP